MHRLGRVALTALGVGCWIGAAPVPGGPTAPAPAPSSLQRGASIRGQDFDCVIEPYQLVKIASPVVGVIGAIYVDRGSFVAKGAPLGKLEDGVEQANLALARVRAENEFTAGAVRARLKFLRTKKIRAEELAAKNVGTTATRDEAESDFEVATQQLKEAELDLRAAQAEVKQAEEIVRQRQIFSPFDGVVTDINLHPGEYRDEQTAILTLAQIDPLRVEVFVPTQYYGQVAMASVAEVMPENPVGGHHKATVSAVDTVLDAASGTFGVRLDIPNPAHKLPAGLKCKVRFAG